MESVTPLADYFRLVGKQTSIPITSQPDFAWEVLRRRADYHPGPKPARRTEGSRTGQPVTLLECSPTADRSWGLLFRRGSASPRA